MNWIRRIYKQWTKETRSDKSIVERLEGLIIPVDIIQRRYKVERDVADAGHQILLATERLIKASLKKQQEAIEASEQLLGKQEETATIIDFQVAKQLDAETIIINFREWLLGDDITIAWMLENALIPAFTTAFSKQSESRQRKLFAGLRRAVNALQKLDGILLQPR